MGDLTKKELVALIRVVAAFCIHLRFGQNVKTTYATVDQFQQRYEEESK